MDVSVIIPSCGRVSAIQTVASILTCSAENLSWEIIVVTPCFFKEAASPLVKQIVIPQIVPPGKARNIGAQQAVGDLLLFVDDDCVVPPDWLKVNYQAWKSEQALVYGGQIIDCSNTYWGQALGWSNFSYCRLPYPTRRFVSSTTLAVGRDVFTAVGGFDEHLMIKEDTDFCFRVKNLWLDLSKDNKATEHPYLYLPSIKVFHNHSRRRFKEFVSYMYRNGRLSGWQVERQYTAGNKEQSLSFVSFIIGLLDSRFGLIFAFVPLSLLAAITMVFVNIAYNPIVILYLPAVLLGKLATWLGILVWRWRE